MIREYLYPYDEDTTYRGRSVIEMVVGIIVLLFFIWLVIWLLRHFMSGSTWSDLMMPSYVTPTTTLATPIVVNPYPFNYNYGYKGDRDRDWPSEKHYYSKTDYGNFHGHHDHKKDGGHKK